MSWMSWIGISIGAAALEKCFNRHFLSQGANAWDYLVGYNLGAIIFILSVFGLPEFGHTSPHYFLLAVSGLLWLMFCIFTFKADQYAEVGVTGLLSRLQLVLVCLGGMIFFGERVTMAGSFGIVLILSGVIFLGLRVSSFSFQSNRGVLFKLLAVFTISIVLLVDKQLVQEIDAKTITFFGYTSPLLFALISRPSRLRPAITLMQNLKWTNVGLGALSCLSYYGLIQSLKSAPITLVLPLLQTELIVVLFMAYIFLNERENFIKKLAASTVILVGAIFMRM